MNQSRTPCGIITCQRFNVNSGMEAINITISDRRRTGVSRPKKHNPATDMTPMVDPGFLLISFFVMTTELSKPKVAPLNMPKEGPSTPLGNSNALTVLLAGGDSAYYYHGNWKEALWSDKIEKTSIYSVNGLRKVIIGKKQWLDVHELKEGSHGLMMLTKSTSVTSYKNLVDVLDETMINDVIKYALVKMDDEEAAWIKRQQ